MPKTSLYGLFEPLRKLSDIWEEEAARSRQWAADHPEYEEAGHHAHSRAIGLMDAAMSLRRVLNAAERLGVDQALPEVEAHRKLVGLDA